MPRAAIWVTRRLLIGYSFLRFWLAAFGPSGDRSRSHAQNQGEQEQEYDDEHELQHFSSSLRLDQATRWRWQRARHRSPTGSRSRSRNSRSASALGRLQIATIPLFMFFPRKPGRALQQVWRREIHRGHDRTVSIRSIAALRIGRVSGSADSFTS